MPTPRRIDRIDQCLCRQANMLLDKYANMGILPDFFSFSFHDFDFFWGKAV
jgi:hypothetical protein